MATSLDARPARSLAIPPPKNLSIPLGRRLDPKMARALMSSRPKRIPRDNGGGGFFPGMGEEMDETEVQVGWAGRNGMGDDTTTGTATAPPKPIIKKVPNTPRRLTTQTPQGVATVAGLGALAPHQQLRGIHRKAVKSPGKVIAHHAAIKVHALAPARNGFMPGFGALDMASLTSPKVLIGAALVGGAWLLLRRKRRRA